VLGLARFRAAVAWIADANQRHKRVLNAVRASTLILYAFHLFGKLGDAARLFA
jgi:hypothetical protein